MASNWLKSPEIFLVNFGPVPDRQTDGCENTKHKTFWDMNSFLVWLSRLQMTGYVQMYRQTERHAYEPTVQTTQVGSTSHWLPIWLLSDYTWLKQGANYIQ